MTLPDDPNQDDPNQDDPNQGDPLHAAPLPAAWSQPVGGSEPLVVAEGEWQPLPPRTRNLWLVGNLLSTGLVALLLLVPIGIFVRPRALAIALALLVLVVLPALGAWRARKRWQYTQWRLDALGFSLRRGRLWFSEVCIPGARVQHLDIKRGPLERRFDLATLVIHTAGTREHALQVSGLDARDAQDLRDRLAVQLDDVRE